MNQRVVLAALLLLAAGLSSQAQATKQPRVAPGANEPNWVDILRDHYGLSINADLKNPITTTAVETPGLFRKAGPGPVRFTPVIALGLETKNRGGWYLSASPRQDPPRKIELWSYVYKNTAEDLRTGKNLPPPLAEGSSTEFDPGRAAFGFWITNDGLSDGGVYSEPGLVAKLNARLAKQPYKAMIYPYRDKASGKLIPHSYLIGWEYSTNDDFQDVVCRVDNAVLIVEPAGLRYLDR
jgi:hypothetical protein